LVVEYASDAPRPGVHGDASSARWLFVVICDAADSPSLSVEEGGDPNQRVLALLDFDESSWKSVMASRFP
jgi:hypothetical protein